MSADMTTTPILRLAAEVAQRGTQAAVAKWLGVSRAHVSDMLAGKRHPGPRVLKKLGFSRTVTRSVHYHYEPVPRPLSSPRKNEPA